MVAKTPEEEAVLSPRTKYTQGSASWLVNLL